MRSSSRLGNTHAHTQIAGSAAGARKSKYVRWSPAAISPSAEVLPSALPGNKIKADYLPVPAPLVPAGSAIAPLHSSEAPILFHKIDAPFYAFTNLSPHDIIYKGKRYPTSEHLFQSLKFLDYYPQVAERIRTCGEQPTLASNEAQKYKKWVCPDWVQVQIQKMEIVLRLKFIQHFDLKAVLLGTGDAELIQAPTTLGAMSLGIMRLRDELRSEKHDWFQSHTIEKDATPLAIRYTPSASVPASNEKIALFEKRRQELSGKIAAFQFQGTRNTRDLGEIIKNLLEMDENSNSLIDAFREQEKKSNAQIAHLTQIVRLHEQKHECEVLYVAGQTIEAGTILAAIVDNINEGIQANKLIMDWLTNFLVRLTKELSRVGEIAMESLNYEEAINCYSILLAFHPTDPIDILANRSKARGLNGSWEEALEDANKMIELDSMSYVGYDRKYAALWGMGYYGKAFSAFTVMLSEMDKSSNPHVRQLREQYMVITSEIQSIISETILYTPRIVIDATTGRLCNKAQQVAAFEGCSMTTHNSQLDKERIRKEVKTFYRYVMFSHKWEDGEPLIRQVEDKSVYELPSTPANVKLQTLCKLASSLGFRWVWSDTCCIDKENNVVLQESLVAMFSWYQRSSLTIVHLRGIWSKSQEHGHLWKSIWNTRAWTYQEYVAATIVQFYTEDWKPYLGLSMFNHKESPLVTSEMEQTPGGLVQLPILIRPGIEKIREKLFLASTRQTTLVEDAAYSLLGIFNVSIPIIYGEGNRAVGRLLEHVLTRSGDASILAWTGCAGDYNSCLPPNLKVYNPLEPPHIPQRVETSETDRLVEELRSSLPKNSLAITLYERLHMLPLPSFALGRLQLPGIVFSINELIRQQVSDSDLHVYLAKTATLDDVEVHTKDDLSNLEGLVLIHPWVRVLFHQEFSHRTGALDKTTRALRLLVRLIQPFGALMLAPMLGMQYQRVAADCLIMVRVRQEVSLTMFVDGVRTVDVQ